MNTNNKNHKNNNFDYKIIILLIVIVLIISYFLLFKDLFKNKYTKMEEEMVQNAKDYVLKNSISTNREVYFDLNKLNMNASDNCSITSGVIFDGVNYMPNLVCNDYKSVVIESNSSVRNYIELRGNDVMIIAKGINFYDPGYISNDVVITAGSVGTEEGVYNIYYKTQNSNNIAIRKVIVIDNPLIRNLFPSISLNGDEIVYVVENNLYTELGAISNDSIDGNISNKVVINTDVKNQIPGEYNVIYTITNSRGYSNTIIRRVNVISKDSDINIDYSLNPNNLTNQDVNIKLSISDEFNKIIYPDGSEGRKLLYQVSENGEYQFKIYDIYDRVFEKIIEVDNIDKTVPEGTCNAIMHYNNTEIKVNITSKREISSYEYVVDGITSNSTPTNTYVSTKVKPSTVKVIVKDIVNNKGEITCSLEDKTTREIVTDSKGKNCLEGYTCYIQYDWTDRNHPYCSMQNNPNSCGGIGRNGCSITSASNAIAAMGVKSKNGKLYNPWTVWEELYPINKNTGQCNGSCSGWTRIRDSIVNAGLTAPREVSSINKTTMPTIIEHLKKGYPVIVYASGAPFSSSKGHYLTLLAINNEGKVFLSDSANTSGINKANYNGKQYYVDTWISPDDLISGNVKEFLLVGPAGMYEGK